MSSVRWITVLVLLALVLGVNTLPGAEASAARRSNSNTVRSIVDSERVTSRRAWSIRKAPTSSNSSETVSEERLRRRSALMRADTSRGLKGLTT